MPKGRSKVQHKGRGKRYLTEEEIRVSEEKKMKEKEWKRKKGIEVESEEEEDEEPGAVSRGLPGELPPSGSSEEESEEDVDEFKQPKQKGVDGLIEVENPNRTTKKSVKARDIDINVKVELSRREREELKKQRAAQTYQKLHMAGKTEEAQRDLARLAIIRQQREEAARKREAAEKCND